MKSRTTLWGAIGGAATAIQALTDLPAWVRLVAIVITAVSFAALGAHSADCPAGCLGTDKLGRRLGPPTSDSAARIMLVLAVFASLVAFMLLSGCTLVRARSYVKHGATTNEVTKGASLWGVSFFDSGQVLGKTRLTYEASTNGTWPPEVAIGGLSQQSSSTGLVTIIQNFPKVVPVP